MKALRTYQYSYSAHLDLAKLQAEGITAVIKDDNIVSINPLYTQAVGGIKLVVNDGDYETAVKILGTNDYDLLTSEFPDEEIEEQRKCIKCGSTNIFQKNSLLMAIFFFIFFFLPITKKKSSFECLEC